MEDITNKNDLENYISERRKYADELLMRITKETIQEVTPYDTLGDYVTKWLKEVNECYEDVIVGIKMKYDHEREYERLNVIFSFSAVQKCGIWEYDWWEGQQEVYLVGIIPISEVDTFAADTTGNGGNFYVKGGE